MRYKHSSLRIYAEVVVCMFSTHMRLHRHFRSRYVYPHCRIMLTHLPTEIYRIVSSKALDQGEGGQNVLGGERKVLEISKSADEGQKKNGCC